MENKLTPQILGMYLGCKVYDQYDGETKTLFGVTADYCQLKQNTLHVRQFDEIKPILRPLSDMSEEEKYECVEVVYNYGVKWSAKESWMAQFQKLVYPVNNDFIHKSLLLHLLSRGFDLFGLLENGLALPQTK